MIRHMNTLWRRMHRRAIVLLALLAVCSAFGQAEIPASRWEQRLEALTPGRPIDYLELAEEITDDSDGALDDALAQRLFALSGLLAPDELGRSACLALADMEEDDAQRRRLLALAALLGSEDLLPVNGAHASDAAMQSHSLSAVLAVTDALSHYRRGQGALAIGKLRTEGARELLDELDVYLPGGVNRFLEDCRHYRGQLRPILTERDTLRLYQLEIALLSEMDRPWSSEMLITRGRPLVEVDPDHLEDVFGIDGERPRYRGGRWLPADRPGGNR